MAVRINNRITFMHIGKCGGMSMTNLLDNQFTTEHSAVRHEEYNDLPNAWKDNVFCIIRNPFDRLLSLYHFSIKKYMKRNQTERVEELEKGFENYVITQYDNGWHGDMGGWQGLTQARYFPADRNKVQVLKLETLDKAWKLFCENNDLKHHAVGRDNSSRADNKYRDRYTKDMIDVVKDKWQQDLTLGGYEF